MPNITFTAHAQARKELNAMRKLAVQPRRSFLSWLMGR